MLATTCILPLLAGFAPATRSPLLPSPLPRASAPRLQIEAEDIIIPGARKAAVEKILTVELDRLTSAFRLNWERLNLRLPSRTRDMVRRRRRRRRSRRRRRRE